MQETTPPLDPLATPPPRDVVEGVEVREAEFEAEEEDEEEEVDDEDELDLEYSYDDEDEDDMADYLHVQDVPWSLRESLRESLSVA